MTLNMECIKRANISELSGLLEHIDRRIHRTKNIDTLNKLTLCEFVVDEEIQKRKENNIIEISMMLYNKFNRV